MAMDRDVQVQGLDLPAEIAKARGVIAGSIMAQSGDPVIDMAYSLRNIEALLLLIVGMICKAEPLETRGENTFLLPVHNGSVVKAGEVTHEPDKQGTRSTKRGQ